MKKFRGGIALTPQIFNNMVDEAEDRLNALTGADFRYPIDTDKMASDTLQRVDVSSRGGVSKVLEHNASGDIRLRPDPDSGTTVTIGSSANNVITFDLGNRAIKFTANGVNSVNITYSGWS